MQSIHKFYDTVNTHNAHKFGKQKDEGRFSTRQGGGAWRKRKVNFAVVGKLELRRQRQLFGHLFKLSVCVCVYFISASTFGVNYMQLS